MAPWMAMPGSPRNAGAEFATAVYVTGVSLSGNICQERANALSPFPSGGTLIAYNFDEELEDSEGIPFCAVNLSSFIDYSSHRINRISAYVIYFAPLPNTRTSANDVRTKNEGGTGNKTEALNRRGKNMKDKRRVRSWREI
jgi:hypothetical protein